MVEERKITEKLLPFLCSSCCS